MSYYNNSYPYNNPYISTLDTSSVLDLVTTLNQQNHMSQLNLTTGLVDIVRDRPATTIYNNYYQPLPYITSYPFAYSYPYSYGHGHRFAYWGHRRW